ncbi:hypothetical protein [Aminipila luticellarii]|uniref:Acetylglutamate kinase n=1 Tax=Aminipila luticellarii TaxID=2507160 RepID=A0A410PTN6_9FIRM|nr:hypothetical protein [Aminipila luticellarii]QAT42260.1 hypothetical protein EQM06_02880 [Aminipila luticellarii]
MPFTDQLQDYNLTTGQLNLLFRLRVIWRDIATWMSTYLEYVFLSSDPNLIQSAKDKLYALPVTYANIFRLYFGDAMADQHMVLMSNYMNLLISLIDATKAGDTDAVNDFKAQIDQNIQERVDLLTSYNPFWEKNMLSTLLINFNNKTIDEINAFASGNYQSNADIFDNLLSYADRMGDFFTEGLLRYFTFSARG